LQSAHLEILLLGSIYLLRRDAFARCPGSRTPTSTSVQINDIARIVKETNKVCSIMIGGSHSDAE
jgi:hypothetical protein